MPGPRHRAVVELLRSDPALLLRLAGLPTDGVVAASLGEDLSEATPLERRADALARAAGATNHVVIGEVQSEPDPEKVWTWPHYATTARARYRCECTLVVIALNETTATWARREIRTGGNGTFTPVVLGPSQLRALPPGGPAVEALRVVANAEAPDAVDLAKVAIESAAGMDGLAFGSYVDLILGALPDLAAHTLEAWMQERWEPQSDYIRRHWLAGRLEGIEEGREEGRVEGVAEGACNALVALGSTRWGSPSAHHLRALHEMSPTALNRCVVLALEVTDWDHLLRRATLEGLR